MRKGLNNTIRNNLKSDEMMRIECPFRRNTRDASLRENEFIRPDLVWVEASRVRDAIGQYPMK